MLRASTQKPASRVFDSRQASTYRLAKSICHAELRVRAVTGSAHVVGDEWLGHRRHSIVGRRSTRRQRGGNA